MVNSKNCFSKIHRLGIKPWRARGKPEAVEAWLGKATPDELESFRRFGPRSYFLKYANPQSGKVDNYFRTAFKPSAVVFAMFDRQFVPVTAEWKHGNNKITITPVAGVPGKAEADLPTLALKMRATALREWKEETGMELEYVIPLAPESGIYSAVRPAEIQYFPFVGKVRNRVEKGPTKFDENEHIALVVFDWHEWLALIETPGLWDQNPDFGLEMCARDVTYAALRKLGYL